MECYNGKELETFNNLETLNYSARFYDLSIVRWNVIDSQTDWCYSMFPYSYAVNVVLGFKSFINNVRQGNFGSYILDGVNVVVEVAKTEVPKTLISVRVFNMHRINKIATI